MPNERDLKISKDDLSQIFYLDAEIKQKKDEMRELRAKYLATFQGPVQTDTVSASEINWPYCLHTSKIEGVPDMTGGTREKLREDYAESIIHLWDASEKREFQRNKIKAYIEEIRDSETRMIFTYRFADGMSLNDTAAKMAKMTGKDYSEDGIRMKINRFLEKF